MKKGKWTQVEEYLIAQGHSRLGSQWCKISSMVPGRTDNAVKNFYNATSRSKALSRPESILWLYISRVRAGLTAAAAFSEALEVWKAHASISTAPCASTAPWPSTLSLHCSRTL
ncbi:transcription factor MYB98 [Haematococcus lacustris]|uniref:Transcription factor MYB98 n=1 Tax=Haematococcus lacustris TaxID=44745 RepID=A0A699YQY0_HAELA|nr:transcription factor MYB98 [Haematococcus lacustris]